MQSPGGQKKNQRATVTLQKALEQRDYYECKAKEESLLRLQTEQEMHERIAFLNSQARVLVGDLEDNKTWKKTTIVHLKKFSAQLDKYSASEQRFLKKQLKYDEQLKHERAENARLRAMIKDMKAAQDSSDSSDFVAPLSPHEYMST